MTFVVFVRNPSIEVVPKNLWYDASIISRRYTTYIFRFELINPRNNEKSSFSVRIVVVRYGTFVKKKCCICKMQTIKFFGMRKLMFHKCTMLSPQCLVNVLRHFELPSRVCHRFIIQGMPITHYAKNQTNSIFFLHNGY